MTIFILDSTQSMTNCHGLVGSLYFHPVHDKLSWTGWKYVFRFVIFSFLCEFLCFYIYMYYIFNNSCLYERYIPYWFRNMDNIFSDKCLWSSKASQSTLVLGMNVTFGMVILAAINCWVIMSWWHCLSMIIWKCIHGCPCTCIHQNIMIYSQNLSNVMLRSISITSFIIHGKVL